MDRVIEKTKTQRLMKYWPYMAGACLVLIVLGWLVFETTHQRSESIRMS